MAINYPLGAFGRIAAPEQAEWVVFRNATVWTCAAEGVLQQASVLLHNGRIEAVGPQDQIDVPDGAVEIDMVMQVGALKAGDDELARRDVAAVAEICRARGALLKAILETGLLTDAEKVRAALAARAGGADFVKTSTGFARGGATPEDVALLRRTVGPELGIKASGGVRTAEDARRLLAAGATRIGASASVAIVAGDGAPEKR